MITRYVFHNAEFEFERKDLFIILRFIQSHSTRLKTVNLHKIATTKTTTIL